MVSHPDVAPHRPSSVSSRASTSNRRHHRHGRSAHGGSSYAPQNEFPFFAQTGDVEIVISAGGQEKRYLLHRLILAQCSGFFDAGTSDEWSRSQAQREVQPSGPDQNSALARIDDDEPGPSQPPPPPPPVTAASFNNKAPPKTRWRYELNWDNVEEDEDPILVQKPPTSKSLFGGDFAPSAPPPAPRTKPPASHSGGFFRSMANLSLNPASSTHLPRVNSDEPLMNETIRDYDNLFRIFYNYSPQLNSTNIAQAYTECKALLNLADMYDALPVTGPRVDHHLLRFSSRLFKQIAKYPPSYLKLGYLARSRIIFSEALIHVVGQWPMALPQLRNSTFEVPETVIELIEDKVDELEEMKAKIEARLFRLTLTTSRGERVNPSNAYLDWLAVSLFRQWLAENTTPLPQPILKHPTPIPGPPTQQQPQSRVPVPNGGGRPSTSHSSSSRPSLPNNHNTSQSMTPLPPNPSRIYRLLGSPNPESYLPHEEIKRFLKLSPLGPLPTSTTSSSHHSSSRSEHALYNRETLRKFQRKLDELKNMARDIVKPLTRNFLELDLTTFSPANTSTGLGNNVGGGGTGGGGGVGGIGYLTCTRVDDEDLPWD